MTNAEGRRVASGHPGWEPEGQALGVIWKPASRGVFTVTWHGVDLAGNHESRSARSVITVP